MKYAIALLLAVLPLCSPPAVADHYAVGYVSDGYTWNGSYWVWRDGSLWTRTWIPGSSYYHCGRYYSTAGYWSYSYYGVAAQPYKAPEVQASAHDDDSTLIAKAVIARDAVRSRITESTFRHQNLISSIQKANLDGGLSGLPALTHGSYAGGIYPSHYAPLLSGSFGLNTSTIYGYAPVSLSQFTNPFAVNLDQYFLSAAQLAQGSQEAAREANSQFNSSVTLAADKAAALSAIAARRDAIVAFSKLLDGPPSVSNSTLQFNVGPASKQDNAAALRVPAGDLSTAWNTSAQKCVACHHGDKREGGFSVAAFPQMSGDDAARVIGRLLLPKSSTKHMPKDAEPLSPEEILAWVQVAAKQPADRGPAMPKLK